MSLARTHARQSAVQALYQWQMAGQDLNEIEQQFYLDKNFRNVQRSYFRDLLHGVPSQLTRLDQALSEFTDRTVNELDPVERAILRIGVYELINRLDVPYKVIVNEGINLAKRFGATDSHKYVNSILDKVAQKERPDETAAEKTKV
ncbi:MAG: transcription antitermination factor NusB [Methylococcales bacterium]